MKASSRSHSPRAWRASIPRVPLPLVKSVLLPALLLLAGAIWTVAGMDGARSLAQQTASFRVSGRLDAPPAGAALEEAEVRLLGYTLGATGRIEENTLATTAPDGEGRFSFIQRVIGRTKYRVVAHLDGAVALSRMFNRPEADGEVVQDLSFPRLVSGKSALRIPEGYIFVEPRRGAAWITEIVHFVNPTANIIEGMRQPLELSLPAGAEDFELLRPAPDQGSHERLGPKLLVYGNLPPGQNTVAFRYRLPAVLGTLALDKRYPSPVDLLTVLAPEGGLTLAGGGFSREEVRTMEKTRYDAWSKKELQAGSPVEVRLDGVPILQELILLWVAAFLAGMAGLVGWFWRTRLSGGPGETEGSA